MLWTIGRHRRACADSVIAQGQQVLAKADPQKVDLKTERVSMCSGSDGIPWDGLGCSVVLFIPSFTTCDG